MRHLFVVVFLGLVGCLPSVASLEPLVVTYLPGPALLRVDPPGVGAGEAVFGFAFVVQNPNPFRLPVAGFTGRFSVNKSVVPAAFQVHADLAANGPTRIHLEVTVPLGAAPTALATDLLRGLARYELGGTFLLRYGGLEQLLPTPVRVETLERGGLEPLPPTVLINRAGSGLREVTAEAAIVVLSLTVVNTGPVGYGLTVDAPELRLVSEHTIAAAPLHVAVPAFGETPASLRFALTAEALRRLTLRRLVGGAVPGDLNATLFGGLTLELPGGSLSLEPRLIARSSLR